MTLAWIVLIVALLLVLGPLRRFAFRMPVVLFVVPAFIGAFLGITYAYRSGAYRMGIPGLPLLLMLFGAGMIGGGVGSSLLEIFRGGKQ
jgi:hypothetical protein